jgi:hypothetical protein
MTKVLQLTFMECLFQMWTVYAGIVIKDTIAGTRKSVVLSQQLAGSRSICAFIHEWEPRRDNVVWQVVAMRHINFYFYTW